METMFPLTELQALGSALFGAVTELRGPYISLGAAVLAGGMIGLEREWANKPAGLRTNLLICVGSCLICIVSQHAGGPDVTRIAAQIVSGVGFIGAGAILRINQHITGVTTAATIWLVAAIGMALGFGMIGLGLTVAIFSTIVLFILGRFELGMTDGDGDE